MVTYQHTALTQAKIQYPWIQYGRILGSLAVINLHVSSHVHPSLGRWLLLVTSIWAVPVFVMISGTLLPTNLIHRLKRLLPPAILWISIYYWYYHPDNIFFSWHTLSDIVVFGNVGHLYYLIVMVLLACATPLLQKLLTNITNQQQLALIGFCVLVGFFWRSSPLTYTYAIPYLGYYLLGKYLADKEIPAKIITIARISFIFCMLALFASLRMAGEHWYLFQHANPLLFGLSVSAFLLIKHDLIMKKAIAVINPEQLQTIASLTMGIYILHPLFLEILWKFQPTIESYLAPLITGLIFICSALTAYLLRKLKIVKALGLL